MRILRCVYGLWFCLVWGLVSCTPTPKPVSLGAETPASTSVSRMSLVVLGTVQDGGSPHIGCEKDCCAALFEHPDPMRKVVSLGVIDPDHQQRFLFEATPDLPAQLRMLTEYADFAEGDMPNGIFLTHAHIGHYTGLMYLGREAMNSQQVPVYAMPRMQVFLGENGPWRQLVTLENISLRPLANRQSVELTPQLHVIPLLVPHRDEFSETVGFLLEGSHKRALFIPDIDKWDKWHVSIDSLIQQVDYAFLDATFYDAAEVNYRDIREIPHPFVEESLLHFTSLPPNQRDKVYFIHFNHTNPLLNPQSTQTKAVEAAGFHVARTGTVLPL